MSPSQEFYAASVEEAVRKAASSLGVPADELSFKVIDEGAPGFLGIGARDARIVADTGESEVPEALSAESEAGQDAAGDFSADAGVAVDEEEGGDASSALTGAVVVPPDQEVSADPAPPEVLEHVERLVSELVHSMGFEGRVDVYDAGDFIAADVAPDHTALFIGQKGETIDALQYLVNAIVYRKRQYSKRVILDAEGYRQRRVEALQGMAHRTARRAVRERRPIELPPMNAAERRVVHLYLRDDPKVTTASEGSGDNRRVRVSPA